MERRGRFYTAEEQKQSQNDDVAKLSSTWEEQTEIVQEKEDTDSIDVIVTDEAEIAITQIPSAPESDSLGTTKKPYTRDKKIGASVFVGVFFLACAAMTIGCIMNLVFDAQLFAVFGMLFFGILSMVFLLVLIGVLTHKSEKAPETEAIPEEKHEKSELAKKREKIAMIIFFLCAIGIMVLAGH